MAPAKNYATRNDSFIRSLDRHCKAALDSQNPADDGPTGTDLAGALLARPGFNEDRLGRNWKLFAAEFPANANDLRRRANILRVSKEQPLVVNLPSNAKTTKKFLLVSNPDYVDGVAIAGAGSVESGAKTVPKRVLKRKAPRAVFTASKKLAGDGLEEEEDDEGIAAAVSDKPAVHNDERMVGDTNEMAASVIDKPGLLNDEEFFGNFDHMASLDPYEPTLHNGGGITGDSNEVAAHVVDKPGLHSDKSAVEN